jgi:hypothetical protein
MILTGLGTPYGYFLILLDGCRMLRGDRHITFGIKSDYSAESRGIIIDLSSARVISPTHVLAHKL